MMRLRTPTTQWGLLAMLSFASGIELDPIINMCVRYDHQSVVKNNTLYIDGGHETFINATGSGASLKQTGKKITQGYNNYLIAIDMSQSWDWKTNISEKALTKTKVPATGTQPPVLSRGALYRGSDSDANIYLMGGTTPYTNVSFPGFMAPYPAQYSLWSYNIGSQEWGQYDITFGSPNRPSSGSYADAWDQGLGFYFNGELDSGSQDTMTHLKDSGKIFLDGLIVVDTNNHTARNLSTQAVVGNAPRIRGRMQYIQQLGGSGILVQVGGNAQSTGPTANSTLGNLVPLSTIDIFDISSLHNASAPSGTWYKQPTSGPTPPPRIDFCLTLASSTDGSSHNLYMYGGRGLNSSTGAPTYYDEIWVLSLPSFTWTNIYRGTSPRYGHTCHRVGERTLLTVGGARSTNYSSLPCDWETSGVGVFDMSELRWGSVFDAKQGNYAVPTLIVDTIGGTEEGGANMTKPVGGWAHPGLEAIFKAPWSVNGTVEDDGNSQGGAVILGEKANGTVSQGDKRRKHTAAVAAGVTVGCLVAVVCAVGGCYYYRGVIAQFLLGRGLMFPFVELGEGREKAELEMAAEKGGGSGVVWELGGNEKPVELLSPDCGKFGGTEKKKAVEMGVRGSGKEEVGGGVVELESPSESDRSRSSGRESKPLGRDKPLPALVQGMENIMLGDWRLKPLPVPVAAKEEDKWWRYEKPLPILKVEGVLVNVESPSETSAGSRRSERSNHDRNSVRQGEWDGGGRRGRKGRPPFEETNWILSAAQALLYYHDSISRLGNWVSPLPLLLVTSYCNKSFRDRCTRGRRQGMEAIGALSGILTVVGSVTKLAKSLNEIKDRYSNVALNTTLVASQLNIIRAALNALYDWRVKDTDQTAPAQQLDKDLGVSLSCCAILISVIEGKLGESGYTPGLKGKIRHLWLEDILKEYISNLESQVRALQLLLTIFQCSSAAEQRQRLSRAESRRIIEDVCTETASLGVESQDIEDRASIYSDNPSVTFDVDPIIMKSSVYQKVYKKVERKPLPEIPYPRVQPKKEKPPNPPAILQSTIQLKKEKPPVPPRRLTGIANKSLAPPVPPRPPPRRRSGAKIVEESKSMEEVERSTGTESVEPDHSGEGLNASQDLTEAKDNEVQSLETGRSQERSSQGADLEDRFCQVGNETRSLPNTEPPDEPDQADSSKMQMEDIVESQETLKASKHASPDPETHTEAASQISASPPDQKDVKCICGTDEDDGKLTRCESCDSWQHAECYYIDEYGIVPTNQDLKSIDHYCAECAPRALRVEEAIERKRKQEVGGVSEEPDSVASLAAEPQAEVVKWESNDISPEQGLGLKVAPSALGDFTSEMENAFRGVQYLPPVVQPVNMSSSPAKLPVDGNVETHEEDGLKTTKPPTSGGKLKSDENYRKPGQEVLETTVSQMSEPDDTRSNRSGVVSTAINDDASTKNISDNLSTANLPAPSIESAHDSCEQPTQEERKSKSPRMSTLGPSVTITSSTEAQQPDTDEGFSSPATSPRLLGANPSPVTADPKDQEDGLDVLISKIRLSRIVNEETANTIAPNVEDVKTQPRSISSPRLRIDPGFTSGSVSPFKVDTREGGRESIDRKSSSAGTPPMPHYPPPMSPTTPQTSGSAVVESVTSVDSSGRTSSVFDTASTVSSELPEVNTIFTTNQSAATDATSFGISSMQTAQSRAQSDLRRLQSELVAAKERGDSKAKEDSIQKSIQVIWDTYLTPPTQDATSPKKSSSPRLKNRASFLRMPSLPTSAKNRTALGHAISVDDEMTIQKLLAEKVNVNGRAEGGETPLMLAASLGHLTSMRLLKEFGADECASDAKGRTALHIAVAYNHLSAAKWLLEAHPPPVKSPPDRSSKRFRAADIARGSRAPKNLRELGDAEGSTALHVATERGTVGMIEMLLAVGVEIEAKDSLGRTPLLRSVISQRRACFETLLERGANVHAVDSKNRSGLHFAAASDQVDIIGALLSKGVNRQIFDNDGTLALHHAGRNGRISAITALINSPSDLNTPTKTGERLLHLASAHNHLPLAEHLLTFNAEVNPFATPVPATLRSSRPTGTQLIPLHYACIAGHLEMSMLLIKHMAWVNAPTDTGFTTLMMAADNEDTNLVNILLEAGAKVNASIPGSCVTALHIAARKGDLETVQQLCRGGASEATRTSGSNGRTPVEEAIRYADADKKAAVMDYLRTLHNNRILAKRNKMPLAGRSGSTASLSIRPGPGTPMASVAPLYSPNSSSPSSHPWYGGTGYPMATVLSGQPGVGYVQNHGQYPVSSGAPPYVPPLQHPLAGHYQYSQQQVQQQQYFDPAGYEAGFEPLPAYEPGPGAPARLVGRQGVYRPSQ